MKKLLSILLVMTLLFGFGAVAASANSITLPTPPALPSLNPAAMIAWNGMISMMRVTGQNFGFADFPGDVFMTSVRTLHNMGVDVEPLVEWGSDLIPMNVRRQLHNEGIVSFPVWERSIVCHLVFRYLLFGFIWM
ncbi:MAG: hypothetical protein FWD06_05645 [Oscillospiraceae bacterium]|nr:hypothetical protein [Oscillospiraceae bacterium]